MARKLVARKTLNAAGLLTTLRACFEHIEESVACFCGSRPAKCLPAAHELSIKS